MKLTKTKFVWAESPRKHLRRLARLALHKIKQNIDFH